MAKGAKYPILSTQIKWYYVAQNARPALPADGDSGLTTINGYVTTANRVLVRPGSSVPATRGGGERTRRQASWEHLGDDDVKYANTVLEPPDVAAFSFDIQWSADYQEDLYRNLRDANASTYAILVMDIRTTAGDGTIGVANGNAEGTAHVFVVQHADPAFDVPDGSDSLAPVTTCNIVDDSNSVTGAKAWDYGEP